ncbi:hypothetical protein [Corynebacterium accolens]|uniref:hypothetical protein n=1 Tax=Corynebacterium accolens TaxID=38284 RepID=UPI00266EE08B|nr:hypothetical protein [Corynebacterium accolens]WKS54945.1 hypothetical protein NLL31_06850 [Corynebacterium accolens]
MGTFLADVVLLSLGILTIVSATACIMFVMAGPRSFTLSTAVIATVSVAAVALGTGLILVPFGAI